MTHELALDPAELTPPRPRQVCGNGVSSRPELRIASGRADVDLDAAERAAADFLAALGIDRSRAGLRETPVRMVRAYGAKTGTSALAGTLRTDARSRAEFFALAGISPP
jgi:GTP cyclohydrolase I